MESLFELPDDCIHNPSGVNNDLKTFFGHRLILSEDTYLAAVINCAKFDGAEP